MRPFRRLPLRPPVAVAPRPSNRTLRLPLRRLQEKPKGPWADGEESLPLASRGGSERSPGEAQRVAGLGISGTSPTRLTPGGQEISNPTGKEGGGGAWGAAGGAPQLAVSTTTGVPPVAPSASPALRHTRHPTGQQQPQQPFPGSSRFMVSDLADACDEEVDAGVAAMAAVVDIPRSSTSALASAVAAQSHWPHPGRATTSNEWVMNDW